MSNCGMCCLPGLIEFLLPHLTPQMNRHFSPCPSCSELIETMKEFMQKQRLHLHFEISSRRLQLMMNLGNIRALEDMGGVEGIAALLMVECDVGLSKEERLDAYIDRIEEYVFFRLVVARLPLPFCTRSCFPRSLFARSPHQFRRQQLSQPRVGQHYLGLSLILERHVLSDCSRARPRLFCTSCWCCRLFQGNLAPLLSIQSAFPGRLHASLHQCAYCSFDADWGWQSSVSTIGGICLNAMLNTGFEYWKMRRVRSHLSLGSTICVSPEGLIIVGRCLFCAFSQHEAHEEVRLDFNVDVKREGMRMEIQASEVLVGDILIVDKGDRVAADGVIYYSTGALASSAAFLPLNACVSPHALSRLLCHDADFWVDETAINPSEAFIPKVANWAPFVLAGTKVCQAWRLCALVSRTLTRSRALVPLVAGRVGVCRNSRVRRRQAHLVDGDHGHGRGE